MGVDLDLGKAGIVGQDHRSKVKVKCYKNRVLTSLLPCFKAKVGVKGQVKVMGRAQRSGSNLWHALVDIRGSALPGAAKSKKSHYQSMLFVCVSLIRGRILIIVRMRSIGF